MSNRLGFTVKKSTTLTNHLKPYTKHDTTSVSPTNRSQPARPKQRASGVRKANTQQTPNSITNYFHSELSNASGLQEPLVVADSSPETVESQPSPDTYPTTIRKCGRPPSSPFSELTSIYGADPSSVPGTPNNDSLRRPLRQVSTETRDQLFRSLIRSYDRCSLENLVWMEIDNKDGQADDTRLSAHNETIMELDDVGTSKKRARAELESADAISNGRHGPEFEPKTRTPKKPRTIKSLPIVVPTTSRMVGCGYLSSTSNPSSTMPLILRAPAKDRSQAFLDIQALYSVVEEEFDDLRRQVRNKLSMKEVEVLLREGFMGEFGVGPGVRGTHGVQVC